MPITRLSQMIEAARRQGPASVAVAAAGDEHSLEAIKLAREAGLVSRADLVGDPVRISAVASQVGLDLSPHRLIEAADDQKAAEEAMRLAADGEAELLMKGSLPTAFLLKAVLAVERARSGGGPRRLMSHISAIEVPTYHKLMIVTDAGMVIAPTFEEKLQLIDNARKVAGALHIAHPKVAVLAAVETVNPKMPATIEARQIAELAKTGRFPGCIVDGPLALDIALSAESARYKGVDSPVAGDTDIFLVPCIEAGNVLGKSLLYLAGGKMSGVITGASVSIPLTSRSESAEGKLASIALAILCGRHCKSAP